MYLENINKDIEEKRAYCGVNHVELISKLYDKTLLKLGRLVCRGDFVVRFYNNKKHQGFYKNRELLEKSVRRAYTVNAFSHREQIIDYLIDLI